MPNNPRPLALTMGDPSGVAPEITYKAWESLRNASEFCFFCCADERWLDKLPENAVVSRIGQPADAVEVFASALPVLPIGPATGNGNAQENAAQAIVRSIDQATEFARSTLVDAIVTNPINKRTLIKTGFSFPGHTEYLAHLCQVSAPIMMLAIPGLRVVPLTIHIPLSSVASALTRELIVAKSSAVARALSDDFGAARPRLGIAGLNPHAGEEGEFGDEENTIIAPAIDLLRQQGIDATGPFPADSLFAADTRRHFDAIICMYHDQALIPLKTLDFYGGVNITLGLPIVRTSPDHGTAFDIAGKNIARADSLIAAIKTARQIANTRAGLSQHQ